MRLVTQVLGKLQIGITAATEMNCHSQDLSLSHSPTLKTVPQGSGTSPFPSCFQAQLYFKRIYVIGVICQEALFTSLHLNCPPPNPKCRHLFLGLLVLSPNLSTCIHVSTAAIYSPCG